MWELQLEPGQSSGLHTHVYPYTFYVLNSSTLEVTGADGAVLLTFTGKVRHTTHTENRVQGRKSHQALLKLFHTKLLL